MENKQRVPGGAVGVGGWAKWVRGIKESTPEIIVALYANQFGCKFLKNRGAWVAQSVERPTSARSQSCSP